MDYTIPAIRFEDDTVVMDSWKIALELEKRYPNPTLHLDEPVVKEVKLARIFSILRPEILPKVPRNLLNPPSAEYFERTRAEMLGMPLAQIEKEKGGDGAWERAVDAIKEMADLLKKQGGPFFLGITCKFQPECFKAGSSDLA